MKTSTSHPVTSPLANSLVTHRAGVCVGPRPISTGVDAMKSLTPLGFELRTVHPAASLYTDYAIPAPHIFKLGRKNRSLFRIDGELLKIYIPEGVVFKVSIVEKSGLAQTYWNQRITSA
jgi:hypothetical protein